MRFIDNTGHIFEMKSYSNYPIGYEYETTPYIFWINSEYSNKLSVRNYYVLPIRMLFSSDIVSFEIEDIQSNVYSFYNITEENPVIDESDLRKSASLSDLNILENVKAVGSDVFFNLGTVYVFGKADSEGTWLTTMCIHAVYSNGTEEYCPITIGGTYVDEIEQLIINARNIGVHLPKDIIKAVYYGQIDSDEFDENLYNIKLKEYLLNHMTIKGQCGNYNSVLASLEWFGWGDNIEISKLLLTDNQFAEQYIHDYFNINGDVLDSFRNFQNTTYIALTVYNNRETSEIERVDDSLPLWGEGKPVFENLFDKTIEVEKNGIIFIKHYYDYTFKEMSYKLSCLSYMLKKYFLPLHLSIHSASVQERVWANDIKLLNTTAVSITEKPIYIGDNFNAQIVNEVSFENTNKYILNNQTLIVDNDYNIFNYYTDTFCANSSNNFILIDDKLCVEIPIYFNSYLRTPDGYAEIFDQTYNCVLILRRNNILIHESHFSFVKTSETNYKSFVVIPKVFNEDINADFWENSEFTLDILCNGLWYRKNFVLDVPEFLLQFNKLEYKYDEDYHKQISGYDSSNIEFNAVMYEPNLVTINDIHFDKEMSHLCRHTGYGAFNQSFSSDFNKAQDIKLLDYYIALTQQTVNIVDNDKYLNRIYIYNLTNESGEYIRYSGTERFGEEKDNFAFTQDVLNLYKAFFTTTGDQKLPYILEDNSTFEYDFYLMHDDNIYYGVFISKEPVNKIIGKENTKTLLTHLDTDTNTKYFLRKYKSDDTFLINRMYVVENDGINHFNVEDIVVASIRNNENLAFNMSLGSKWEFKHISLGAVDMEDVTSKTNIAIMSIDKNHIKYVKGYYSVTVNYSVDDYYSHNKTLFGKILIK